VTDRRRGRGESSVYFEHEPGGTCRDRRYHRSCAGRWRGEITTGWTEDGKRLRKRVNARTKSEVYDRLKEIREELEAADKLESDWTVQKAVDEWLEHAMDGRAAKTLSTIRERLAPLLDIIGETLLSELTAKEVRNGLVVIAETRSTRTVGDTRAALVRAITYAQAHDKVGRNVAQLTQAPKGKGPGRPSRSLNLDQALAVLKAAEKSLLYAYIVLSLLTGVRTEEARALRWDHVDLDGNPDVDPPVPPHVLVWRSVRVGGDTKTEKSRRTLGLAQIAVQALQRQQAQQEEDKALVGPLWEEHGLVFTTMTGRPLDPANVRREFRKVCKAAGIGEKWTPREMRHTFVSLMSHSGVSVEEIARLAGHANSRVTEMIYRHELRPVITTGAEVMDQIFGKS
jgi:integrase